MVCTPLTVGYFGVQERPRRRLVKVVCFDAAGVDNYWGRPIEGLVTVVDLAARHVVQVIDTGPVPGSGARVDFDEAAVAAPRTPPNPIRMAQPLGASYAVDGRTVSWQKWRFHFGIDPRSGPVISMVHYEDGGAPRSILYQGTLSELFVPYMDPGEGWYFRTYMDAGEFGIGKLAAPLQPELDCPAGAAYFGAVFADDWGGPYSVERAACIFERDPGDTAWRHYEAVSGRTEVRRRTDLVVRFVATVGNYDYTLDWVFRQDGTIHVGVGASGTEQVKGVINRTATEEGAADTAYGRMVGEYLLAVNHDVFFSFRLDLDVEGAVNSFVVDRLRTRRLSHQSPRRSVWGIDQRLAETELGARLRVNLERPALWRVINRQALGPLGYPVSYQVQPSANALSLLTPNDFPQRRAGFTDYHLWVTPYEPDERYAAGLYPNQNKGGAGLPAWTTADRPIVDTDLVLWYTLGFHHVVRAEDWPVLPTSWHSFELRPFDFFDGNPALDIPAEQ